MLSFLVLIIAVAWIAYRVFFMRQFLFWDWSDGNMELFWKKDKYHYED